MGDDIAQLSRDFQSAVLALIDQLLQPWVLAQLAIAAALVIASRFLGGTAEQRLERHVRAIHGQPLLLRLVALLLRRSRWIALALLLWGAALVLGAVTIPRHSELIVLFAWLVTAWVIISVVSRLIRSRLLGRLVAYVAWTYIALELTGLWPLATRGLDALAIDVGEVRISLLLILQASILIVFLFWLAVVVGDLLEARLAREEDLTPSLRILSGKIVKLVLLGAAGIVALTALGIDLTALAVFSGALGLGVGFGLQKVVSNYLSGIIILADKSIKPGDTVSLGDRVGWIRSIRARFVSVITRDGVEYLIPNEDLITHQVINWSFTDNLVRIDVTFGVAYASDPHEVRRIAVEVTRRADRVVAEPSPVCHLTGFGDSSIDFILRFWIADPRNGLANVKGAVLLGLWDAFKAAGIEIPFPQRDVHVRTPAEMLPSVRGPTETT